MNYSEMFQTLYKVLSCHEKVLVINFCTYLLELLVETVLKPLIAAARPPALCCNWDAVQVDYFRVAFYRDSLLLETIFKYKTKQKMWDFLCFRLVFFNSHFSHRLPK